MPFLPLEADTDITMEFAMNGVIFDSMLPIQVVDEVCCRVTSRVTALLKLTGLASAAQHHVIFKQRPRC